MMCVFIAIVNYVNIGFYIWTLLMFLILPVCRFCRRSCPTCTWQHSGGNCATVKRHGPFLCQVLQKYERCRLALKPLIWLHDGFSEFSILAPKYVWLSCWKRLCLCWVLCLGKARVLFCLSRLKGNTQKLSTSESKVFWQVGGSEPLVTYDRTKVHNSWWHSLLSCYLLSSFFFFSRALRMHRVSLGASKAVSGTVVTHHSHMSEECSAGGGCWNETRRHANNRQSLSFKAESMCWWEFIGVTLEWHWAWRPASMC